MNQRWEKGSSGLSGQFRFITLILLFHPQRIKRDLLSRRGFINLLTLMVLISFNVKHRRRIFRIKKGTKGKGEGMVYVCHHCRGQSALIRDLAFCSHCLQDCWWSWYRSWAPWTEFTLLSLFLRIDSIFRPKCWGFSGNLYPITFCIYLH